MAAPGRSGEITAGILNDRARPHPENRAILERPRGDGLQGEAVERKNRRLVFLAVTCASFLANLFGSAVTVALPSVGNELGISRGDLSLTLMLFLLVGAVLMVPAGRLADLWGRRAVFLLGLGLFALFCVLGPMAGTRGALLAGALVGGTGIALSYGTSLAILVKFFPPGERGKIFGLHASISFLALTSGPYVGGLLTTLFGWRSIFWACLPLAAAGIVLASLALPRERQTDRGPGAVARFDGAGALLYASALALVLVGFSSLSRPAGPWSLAAGVLLVLGYVRYARRASDPVMPLALFSNRLFALSNLASMIHYASTYGTAFLLGVYLQDPALGGLSPAEAGRLLLVQPLVQAAVSPLAGALSDRVEARWLASGGLGVCSAALLVLGWLGPTVSRGSVAAILALLGLGYALFASPNNNAIMSSVDPSRSSLASGVLGTFRILGMAFSMATTTLVLSSFAGAGSGAEAFLGGFHTCFRLFSALAVAGAIASLARGQALSRA